MYYAGNVFGASGSAAFLCTLAVFGAAGCAAVPRRDDPQTAYVVSRGAGRLARYAPLFVLQTWAEDYNRIGAAAVRGEGDAARVLVDPSRSVVYARERGFLGERGRYTNLIYRVHFPRVPLPNVTVGRNVGLLAIVTLDEAERPVLVTTVHTCGCYLAFVPTSYLPAGALPEGREPGPQKVHGEVLPGRLNYPPEFAPRYRPAIFLRDGTHRVMDVQLVDLEEAPWRYRVMRADLAPIAALDALPADGQTTSFFETSGARKGFVKGSSKPLERLLMSWWALDWRVGQDKRYGPAEEMNTTFYTSLKPWRRQQSDMWPFAEFLRYWGWRL